MADALVKVDGVHKCLIVVRIPRANGVLEVASPGINSLVFGTTSHGDNSVGGGAGRDGVRDGAAAHPHVVQSSVVVLSNYP